MKKLLIAFSSAVVLVLVFMGGIYAANQDWLSFTGDKEITQADKNVDEIMKILRQVNTDKMTAEEALKELEDLNPSGLAKRNKELKDEVKKLEGDIDQLEGDLEKANGTIGLRDNYIDHLEAQLTTANEKVESHAGKVSKALEDAKELVGENED